MDLVEDRHDQTSTIITSQIPVTKWHDLIGEGTIADAILDRIVNTAAICTRKLSLVQKVFIMRKYFDQVFFHIKIQTDAIGKCFKIRVEISDVRRKDISANIFYTLSSFSFFEKTRDQDMPHKLLKF